MPGVRAFAGVSASATTQAQAERSLAGEFEVKLTLARQSLRDTANERSQGALPLDGT